MDEKFTIDYLRIEAQGTLEGWIFYLNHVKDLKECYPVEAKEFAKDRGQMIRTLLNLFLML